MAPTRSLKQSRSSSRESLESALSFTTLPPCYRDSTPIRTRSLPHLPGLLIGSNSNSNSSPSPASRNPPGTILWRDNTSESSSSRLSSKSTLSASTVLVERRLTLPDEHPRKRMSIRARTTSNQNLIVAAESETSNLPVCPIRDRITSNSQLTQKHAADSSDSSCTTCECSNR